MVQYNSMPKEEGLEQGLTLLREGYSYISNRCQSFQSNVFETRLLGEKAYCMRGQEAAKVFYDNQRFKREGAAPKRAQKTLLGEGGVQGLDGEAHRHRKAMFMSLMNTEALENMRKLLDQNWKLAVDQWMDMDEVVLYEETKKIIMRAISAWAGVPLPEEEVEKWANNMAAMFETPVTVGWEQHQGRKARRESEKWIETMVKDIRDKKLYVPEDKALYQFSWHRDQQGNLLDPEIVAVEIVNVLRPAVAVAIYVNFTALAIVQHPEERKKLHGGDDQALDAFVQEVRRFYPFFPFNGARVKEDFVWQGYKFEKDALTLLDFYGTNHDPEYWENPELFQPGRNIDWENQPFTLIPQGGGDHNTGHRCPGEWITVDIMKISLDYLANKIEFDLPKQDFSYSLTEIPSLPKSRFIMKNISRK
jgi:fatty-acid peroxygenase